MDDQIDDEIHDEVVEEDELHKNPIIPIQTVELIKAVDLKIIYETK
jgi:hypothetical protein